MAITDLDILKQELPEVFKEQQEPFDPQEWIVIPIDDIEGSQHLDESGLIPGDESTLPPLLNDNRMPIGPPITPPISGMGDGGRFPGMPVPYGRWRTPIPPPDALAFYLPYHFYPNHWGIYLTIEGIDLLAKEIFRRTATILSWPDALLLASRYLYGHELFHHQVECFSIRLETTHRIPTYKDGFLTLYLRGRDTDKWLEEGIAEAWALKFIAYKIRKWPKAKRGAAIDCLVGIVGNGPPGYRMGAKWRKGFNKHRDSFAEENHSECFAPAIPRKSGNLWRTFPHGFRQFAQLNSRVNYIIHRDSPIASRAGLGRLYLPHREVIKKLNKLFPDLKHLRTKGSHEIWDTGERRKLTIPKHSGDPIRPGTLKAILRQAGLKMSLTEFASS